MFKRKELRETKERIQEFFDKMGFSVQINASFEDETLSVNLKSNEPQILIGRRGEVLRCLQKILGAILAKRFERDFYLQLDINEYKKKKAQYLREIAQEIANEVVLTKKEKILPVMSSYERRIIHLELSERSDVVTKSIGEEPERRIVIELAE